MTVISILKCPEFEKDLKRLCKKYLSLEKEFWRLEEALKLVPILVHSERINGLWQEILLPVYKLRRIRCDSLQSTTKLRLIYAYDDTKQEIHFIQFLEMYAKGEQEVEDRGRIEKYLKGRKGLGEDEGENLW